MTEQVLILALGATRKRAVVEDAAEVVARGGRVTVLITSAADWRRERFAPGVRVVDLTELEGRRLPLRVERAVLYRAPRLAFRAVGRGRLAGWTKRAGRAYERRIADRVHRRVFLPAYHRLRNDLVPQRLAERVVTETAADLLVVADPASIPLAARIVRQSPALRVGYGLPYLTPAAPS
ncbi:MULTISPECIES: hypothetical protein [unclassified Micromonospora]|uniref:hypothetical protein n=1 Tax=unclassified Micromonospora TaxID=2617518 RepID=UPI000939181B|nr:hypothetical protein [Micromonospora sp. CB01531]OKI45220.1 hypothetical protein A6A27_12550 [Micromonospora sp. CB01531]